MNKEQFDKQAEAESLALDKQGKNTKDKRIRFETNDYNACEFEKLFVDRLHRRKKT